MNNSSNPQIFEFGQESNNKRNIVTNNWYFISNSIQLSFIISNGLIIEHYGSDHTKANAGWIRLFAQNNISSDTKHEDIIIKINASSFTGPVMTTNGIGEYKSKQFPEEVDGNEQEILRPGPLPITCITDITFPSKQSRDDFTDRASTRKNEKLDIFTLKVKKPPKKPQTKTPPTNLPQIDLNHKLLDNIRIAAAIRGLVFKFANRDKNASSLYNKVYSSSESITSSTTNDLDDIFKELGSWQKHGDISPETKENVTKHHVNVFWNIVNSISDSSSEKAVYDTVIIELNKAIEIMEEDKKKGFLTSLKEDLAGIRNLSEKSAEELFKDYPNSFSRSLIIFFTNEKASQFVKYKNSELKMVDLLVASLLCGARENWTSFPSEIKGTSLFINEQSNFMARMFHERANTEIKIKTPNRNILPLYDLLLGEDSNTKKHEEMRVWIAKTMDWKCVEYKAIVIKKESYNTKVTNKGIEMSSDSPIFYLDDKVTPEFSKYLAEEYIESSVEEKIREKLK